MADSGFSASVSRVGPSTPRPPAGTLRGGQYPAPGSSKANSVATVLVIVASLATLIGMMVLVVMLRRKRIREERLNMNHHAAVEIKRMDEEAAQSADGKWSTDTVELVVMAGETMPTFLAHPVPAFDHVIECPPLVLK